jgi:succinoglycan biosynthesis transport protein ExoP
MADGGLSNLNKPVDLDLNDSVEEPQRSEIHLAEYWAVAVKRRKLILIVIGLVLLATGVRSFLTKPTYRAVTTLNIEQDQSSPYDVQSGVQIYYTYNPEFLATQTRMIQSRDIALRVVKQLNLANDPEFTGSATRVEVGKGAADRNAVRLAQQVQGGVSVTPIRGTDLVELSYISTSPRLAAQIANGVADAYIDWQVESKFQTLANANRFLTGQAEQLRSEISSLEQRLQTYSRQKDIVGLEGATNVTVQNLELINKDYSAAVADRVAKEARYRELQNARADVVADTLGSNISQLRNEQARMEREYAEKLNLYKPEWPAMQQLKAQIDKGRQHLATVVEENVSKAREMARSDYLTALRREESLKGVLQGQKREAMTLNTNAVEYNNLKVEIDTKKGLLDALLKRQSEIEMRSRLRGEKVSNLRVLDRALEPTYRFRPSYRRNAMMGAILGVVLGLGLAFFLEYLDRSLRTPAQVESYLRIPALGIIPAVGSRGRGYGYGYYGYGRRKKKKAETNPEEKVEIELLPHTHPRSTVAEAYRAFRAALLLSRAGGVQSIVITSSLPGEGKTSTAANLAVVLGQVGKRVLLVDADLHKPRIHQVFHVSNRVGLVSILAQNLEALTAIQKTNIPNVWVVPAGPSSPNPSGLLSSMAMADFLETAKKNFDYVIIDTPPLGPVADAVVVGHSTDGVVIATQAGRTPRELVRRVRDKLALSNVRVLGVLINNLQEDPVTYEQYYKYYGTDYTTDIESTPRAARA